MLGMPLFKKELHTTSTYYSKNILVLLVFKTGPRAEEDLIFSEAFNNL